MIVAFEAPLARHPRTAVAGETDHAPALG